METNKDGSEAIRVNILLYLKHLSIIRTNNLNLSQYVRDRLEELGQKYPSQQKTKKRCK